MTPVYPLPTLGTVAEEQRRLVLRVCGWTLAAVVLTLCAACSTTPDEPQLMHAYWLESKRPKLATYDAGAVVMLESSPHTDFMAPGVDTVTITPDGDLLAPDGGPASCAQMAAVLRGIAKGKL